ncbi:hypothetical protein BaRGS_00039239 [Batillaria attramentaria]|uniref:WAP domain-containing protein n=1 Tax=Batillaria attramentaria TaxID=370345 RepID=A0ABD0J3W9_9CAEN
MKYANRKRGQQYIYSVFIGRRLCGQALGASVVSSLSLIPQQCLAYPCAPPPPDWVYPWCEHQCTVNSDCGRRGLCCPGCGCRVCQQGAPIDSCKNRVGPEEPGNCPQYRCLVPQFPTCSHKCNTDKDCKGNLKCCTDCTGCRTCLTPWGITNNGCSNMNAYRALSTVSWIRAGSLVVKLRAQSAARCPNYYCPPYDSDFPRPACPNPCSTDDDCGESGVCCPRCGCGVCINSVRSRSVALPDQRRPECQDNTDCPGGEVCLAGICLQMHIGHCHCFVDPCRFASCEIEGAECRANYCGGCHAVWYKNGQIVTNCYGGVTA